MRLNGNIASLQAQRYLATSNRAIARALERLSTGSRVLRASDDVVSLSQGETMSAEIRGLARAAMNINESFGYLNTAESALSSQVSLVQRMRELAMQAANGSLSVNDRAQLQTEFDSLFEEYDRIASETTYNDQKLLDGSLQTLSIQSGSSYGDQINLGISDSLSSSVFTEVRGTGIFSGLQTYGDVNSGNGELSDAIQSADIDGDGDLDLINVTGIDQRLTISFNDGDGQFSERLTYALGFSVSGVKVGDLNGDESLDIVVAGASMAYVYTQNSSGTFSLTSTLNAPGNLGGLDLGDVNGDSVLDLALANYADGGINIALGNGNGTFQAISTVASAYTLAYDPEFDDINGDGILDLLVAHGLQASVALGNGNGTFATMIHTATGNSNRAIAAADFDGDGYKDIALIGTNAATLQVLRGNGNGTFQTPTLYTAAGGPSFDIGDINNDGAIDIVAGSEVFLNSGIGTFTSTSSLFRQTTMRGVTLGDFDGDGVLDLGGLSGPLDQIWVATGESEIVSATQELDISTSENAQNVLGILDSALSNLVSRQAAMGAAAIRLESTASLTQITRENLSDARSKFFDADVGEETAELIRNQILQQAQIAAMSQANLSSQIILNLLR